jgi:anti-sigma B factor antagonist
LEEGMKITVRTVGDACILDCKGKITMGEPILYFRNKVHDVLEHGASKIILDLGRIKHIDKTGIGELVKTFSSVTSHGGQMKLLNLTKKVDDPMAITELLTVFSSYNNEKSAMESFR